MKDINLLPEDLKEKEISGGGGSDLKESIEPKKILIALGIIFGLAVIFFLPLLYNKYLEKNYKNTMKQIESETYDVVREVNAEILAMREKVDSKTQVVYSIDNTHVQVSEILVALKSILPEGCNITNVNYNRTKLNVSGRMKENIQVGEIISRAERYKFFRIDENSAVSYNDSNNYNFAFDVIPTKGG